MWTRVSSVSMVYIWLVFFPLSLTRLLLDLIMIWVTWMMSYEKQELLTFWKHLGSSPGYLVGSILLIFLVFCVFLVFVLCLMPNVPYMSLDCLFMIPLPFSGPSWSYGSWIYNYLCNQCLSPLTLWVQTLLR